MRGFDDKALVLFPRESVYDGKGTRYRSLLQVASDKLIKYLRSINMEPRAFLTDDLAWKFDFLHLKYISTLTDGDLFFVQRNCEGMYGILEMDKVHYTDICNDIAKKLEVPKGCSAADRFEIIQKRDKKAVSTIIPMYKVVVHFYRRYQSNYKVAIRPDDGKIRILIDPITFQVETYIGGKQEDPTVLLGVPYANRALHNWEVE